MRCQRSIPRRPRPPDDRHDHPATARTAVARGVVPQPAVRELGGLVGEVGLLNQRVARVAVSASLSKRFAAPARIPGADVELLVAVRVNAAAPMVVGRQIVMIAQKNARRPRAQDADRHVGVRVRECRLMSGMTQSQLAELIGITYQQEHKYERGINRIAAGRLHQIAGVLGVDVGYFYEGLQGEQRVPPTTQQRMLLELSRNFLAISKQEHRAALAELARALAEAKSEEALAA